MKKKRLVLSLSSAMLAVAPIATVMSCGIDFGKNYEYYGDIQVITDAGTVSDKSFNQSAFEAVKDYAQLVNTKTTFGYSQPKTTTSINLQKAYESALKKGTKTLVLPGFTHADVGGGDAISFAHRMHSSYPNVKYICADGFASNPKYKSIPVNNGYTGYTKNKDGTFSSWGEGESRANKDGFYNLSYASAESGFMAAVYGGIYFNKVKQVTSPIKAATFGGQAIPYGVTSYMDGYLQGVEYFNDIIAQGAKSQWQKITMIFASGTKASKADFTGSFDSGAATSSVTNLITHEHVQMILPVAGPQTGDVAGVIASTGNIGKVFTFGVDVDQSKVYNSDYFLGSAIKGVYVSNAYAIDELKKATIAKSVHKSFPAFNMALTTERSFSTFVTDLRGKLKGHYTKAQIDVMVKPTGFVPSAIMPEEMSVSSSTNSIKAIYDVALQYVIDGHVQGGLGAGSTGDAKKAYDNFGGFLEVANAK